MWRGVVAAALALGCRGEPAPAVRDQPPAPATPPARVAIPPLPQSPDGAQELVALDLQIEHARAGNEREALIGALSRRAMLRQRIEDFLDAAQLSEAWIADDADNPRAWAMRVRILTQVHDHASAQLALDALRPLAADPSEWEPLAATLDELRGEPERARPHRERAATVHPTATNLTALAGNLALRGELDAALALIPRAATAIRDPSPILVAWLLVQWGRLHAQHGEPAAARALFEEAHRRLPGYVEATLQLGAAIQATGGDPRELATAALAAEPRHPELLALAGRTAEAHRAWTVYLQGPLARAFADHAARFYLGAGRDPARAAELARVNFTGRGTLEARALVVEAALATARWPAACEEAAPLVTGTRAHQFLAWRAFSACGQTTEADRLARTLGIR